MRHRSRTHRVALDWLFDKINLDQKNQIKHVDTKHQLADFLTEGNFTRDEWKKFPGFTTLGLNQSVNLSNSQEGDHLHWGKRGNRENGIANAHRITEYARRFTPGHRSFLGP